MHSSRKRLLGARLNTVNPPSLPFPPPQVLKVNGKPVNNLKDLVAAVEGSTGQYLELSLEYNQVPRLLHCRPERWLSCWPCCQPLLCLPSGNLPPTPCAPLCVPQLVILDQAAAQAATADILTQHCIPHDRSEDLRADAVAAGENGSAAGDAEAGAADGGLLSGGPTPAEP